MPWAADEIRIYSPFRQMLYLEFHIGNRVGLHVRLKIPHYHRKAKQLKFQKVVSHGSLCNSQAEVFFYYNTGSKIIKQIVFIDLLFMLIFQIMNCRLLCTRGKKVYFQKDVEFIV